MADATRPATLRTYARVLRGQLPLIALVTVVCAGAAFGFSKAKSPTYTAQTSVFFLDESATLDLPGAPPVPGATGTELAASAAKVATGPIVLGWLKAFLHTPMSIAELGGKVSASSPQASSLVNLRATDRNPRRAALIADALAEAVTTAEHGLLRDAIGSTVRILDRRMRALGRSPASAQLRVRYAHDIRQLQAAASVVKPGQVSGYAPLPKASASSRAGRNSAIGAVIGLLLGVLLAFVIDGLGGRLRGIDRIHDAVDVPMVGAIPRGLLGSAGPGLGDGAANSSDLGFFRILLANFELVAGATPRQKILVTSAMPGEGKSTVAAWLALTAAVRGQRVVLLESDIRHPQLAERLNLSPAPGLSEFLTGGADAAEILQSIDVARIMSTASNGSAYNQGDPSAVGGLACVVAGTPSPGDVLRGPKLSTLLAKLADEYELIIIDGAPLLPVADTLHLLRQVDGALLCVRDAQTTDVQAHRASELAAQALAGRIGLVATGVKPSAHDEYGYYATAYPD